MDTISNKVIGVLIGVSLLGVAALYAFGSNKNEIPDIPDICKPFIKDCERDLGKQFSELINKISTNQASPDELGVFGDILGQIDKNKDLIAHSKDPEIKFLIQSVSKEGNNGPTLSNYGYDISGGTNGGNKIIYLTSYVDRYLTGFGNDEGNKTKGGGDGGNKRSPYRCPNPLGGAIEHGKTVFLYKKLAVNYPEQCQGENRVCDNGTLLGSFTEESCTQIGKSCSTDRGVIEHGKSIPSYKSTTVPFGEDCDKNINSITCTDGKLNGTLQFKSCSQLDPKGCIGPDGKIRGHGVIGAYYKTAQLIGDVADGTDTCIRKSLKCENGTWRNMGGGAEGFGGFNQLTCTARINTQQ